MIKSFSASTHEVDDIDIAVSEILAQLDLGGKNHLLKNTVGIVSCYAGYIETGVYAAIAKALPFGFVGATTILDACAGELGETMFGILVLTSDDVSFSAALSDPITENSDEPLKAMYQNALKNLPSDSHPVFMLSYTPLFSEISVHNYVESMTKISSGIPNFGAVSVDHNSDYHESYVLHNGEYWKNRFAILLFQGDVKPSFFMGTVSDEKTFPEKGIVTSSSGNILKSVNGKSAVEYLLSLGLSQDEEGGIIGLNSFPLIVDRGDGLTPIAQAMLVTSPEGHIVCADIVPEGSSLAIGSFNMEELEATAKRCLKQALSSENHSTLLVYSCIGRYFALSYDSSKEMKQLSVLTKDQNTVYIAAYVGGEICPLYTEGGKIVNRNHGNSFIVCAF